MNELFKVLVCSMLGILIFSSCKKDKIKPAPDPVQVDTLPTPDTTTSINIPPVAVAGDDITVELPRIWQDSSIILDGSASFDPDGKIIYYEWEKISGLDVYCLNNVGSKLALSCLIPAIYKFRLKVVDNNGGEAFDTIKVTAHAEPRPLTNIHLELVGNHRFADYRLHGAATGNKIFFAADNSTRVDIYDIRSNTWSELQLSEARNGITVVSSGYKTLFAGGGISSGPNLYNYDVYYRYDPVTRVDIYDPGTNTVSRAELSVGGMGLASAAWDNKVFFAGGYRLPVPYVPGQILTTKVDIYNAVTGTWTVSDLSETRGRMSATAASGKIFFAGHNSSGVDIYDVNNKSWSVSKMTDSGLVNSIAVDNKIFWLLDTYHKQSGSLYNIEIYDVNTQQRSFKSTYWPVFESPVKLVVKNNKLLFIQGYVSGSQMTLIDVYDLSTDSWSIARLNQSLLGSVIVAVGGKIFVAGGDGGLANKIWTLEF